MTMEGDSIWGSKDYQVPQYFNFADVIDDWAGKEKVTALFEISSSVNILAKDIDGSTAHISMPCMSYLVVAVSFGNET